MKRNDGTIISKWKMKQSRFYTSIEKLAHKSGVILKTSFIFWQNNNLAIYLRLRIAPALILTFSGRSENTLTL